MADAFNDYLLMLAQHLGQLSEGNQSQVYIEFNNELQIYDAVNDVLIPSNQWLFEWVDKFYLHLVSNNAQTIARKIMINGFRGDPYVYTNDCYVRRCWCDTPDWTIDGTPKQRIQFVSGHNCGNWWDTQNRYCEYLDQNPPGGEDCQCQRRISFFTEGGMNAGATGCDHWVHEALKADLYGQRFHFAIGYNNVYRWVAPWGSCAPMSDAVAVNDGILCAVIKAREGNPCDSCD